MGDFQAVCYKCSYVGATPTPLHQCPICEFPFILEASATPPLAPDLRRIFDRTSVRIGAPPLPGVDEGPRKAALLVEARRKRAERARVREHQIRAATEASRRFSRRLLGLAITAAVAVVLVGAAASGAL